MTILYILLALLIFGFLIFIHELGHFIENVQFPLLGRVLGRFLVQLRSDHVADLDGVIIMLWCTVDEDPLLPLEPVHKPRGHAHFIFQKRRQPPAPGGNMLDFHGHPPFR